jgi:hypothetical protein
MKRKNPDTSTDAYRQLDPIKISQRMQKIADGLKVIGKGNYEDISLACGLREDQVWKRLIDCMKAGLIHRTPEKKRTKDNRDSYIFAPGPATQIAAKKERVMKGKSIVDFSRKLIQPQQDRLF